jgi:cystathionine beta-lyase/cystathionine gamma-synthase
VDQVLLFSFLFSLFSAFFTRDESMSDKSSEHPRSFGAVVPPIYQTSLFTFESFEEMEATFEDRGVLGHPFYSRGNNPTVQVFEEKMAALERGEKARAFSSGMAAISTAILSRCAAGSRVVCVEHVYPDAFKLLTQLAPRYGVEVEFVDGRDLQAIERALPGATVLYLESPSSTVFHLQDLPAVTALAKAHGVFTIIDNSWATPLFQRPLELGVDMVVHSASKYLGGHSDTVAGVLVGRAADVDAINRLEYNTLGGKLSPFEGWLLLRGLRTLPLRMAAHQASTLEITKRLEAHKKVGRINYPGLKSFAQTDLAAQLEGKCGLFSFELNADREGIKRFVNALEYFKLGVSWGGHESLVFPITLGLLSRGPLNPYHRFGVPENTIRLHVGLEHVEDLWSDLERALALA